MGAAKDQMMEDDDSGDVAEEIAGGDGFLERCKDHGYLVDPLNNNHDDAYA